MPTSTVPAEIWIYIAQYISQRTLRSMMSINRTFYELAMNARYKQINISTFGDNSLVRMEELRDPAIAPRVRRLRIKARFHHGRYCLDPHASSLACLECSEIAKMVTSTVTCFTNVMEFSIDWTEGPDKQLFPFITAVWKTFGLDLQKLSFRVQLRHLTALLSTAGSLPALNSVNVDIQGLRDILPGPNKVDSGASTKLLAQFVNKLAPTLRTLILSSWTRDIDFSPLFCHLRNIPNLAQFGMFILHNASTSEVLSRFGLAHFLQSHATTLRHLHWTGDLWDTDLMKKDGQSNKNLRKQRLLDWFQEYELDHVFSNLVTLQVSVSGWGTDLPLLMQCIISSAPALDSLHLENGNISYDDLNALGYMFADRRTQPLRELDIDVYFLSPELIMLLACSFPFLEHLGIEFSRMTAQNGVEERYPYSAKQELALLQKFSNAMKNFDIPHWPLHDITVTTFYPRDEGIHLEVMRVLAESIPSVRTFDGVEKELYVYEKTR